MRLLKWQNYGVPVLKAVTDEAFDAMIRSIEEDEGLNAGQKGQKTGLLYTLNTPVTINEQGRMLIPKKLAEEQGMEAGGMVPYERIDVFDVDNASRFSTYLIEGERGSGACEVNGAAARLVNMGDKLIIVAYCQMDEADVQGHKPRVVLVHDDNALREVKDFEGAGVKLA